jgi:hypothetical protein
LDTDLVPNSVAILASSSPVTGMQLGPGNMLSIQFHGIELPGTSDPGNNKGWVIFSVDIKPGLANGTTIASTAAITFDQNAPVATNTVINTINSTPCPTPVTQPSLPVSNYLGQNYPNPFNPMTTIEYGLSTPEHVELVIYDISGALVRRLVSGAKPAGWYSVQWDGRDQTGRRVASGVYLSRMTAGSFTEVRKLVLLK